ncbi:MAG: DUF6261 family protein [Capnocytophaga sp.]|nr:DUF6261 family protein [Capnocytophaga sp.]
MKLVLDVKNINLIQLNSVEYAHFIKSMLDIIKSIGIEHLNIEEEVYNQLLKRHEQLTEATRQSSYSTETQKINSLDKQRSEYLTFLLSSFRLGRKNPIENKKEAAKTLYNLTKSYTGSQSLPIGQKTQTIEGLLFDLKKPTYIPLLETLEVNNVVELLTEVNKDIQKLVAGRAESQITNVLINSKKVRKEATELYKYVAKCIFSQHMVTQSSESANGINLLNKLITDTMNANKQRLALTISNRKNTKTPDSKQTEE